MRFLGERGGFRNRLSDMWCRPYPNALIAGRAVAGCASAGIFSGCIIVVIGLVPLRKRPMFQGLFGAVFGIASVMGPLMGGGFTGSVSWRLVS